MFIHLLTPDQRRTLIAAARHMARLDGTRAEIEAELLEALNREAELDDLPDTPADVEDLLDELASTFADQPTQAGALLLELAGLAVIDEREDPAEIAFLEDVLERVGAVHISVEDYVGFARDARDLSQRGAALIAAAGVEVDG